MDFEALGEGGPATGAPDCGGVAEEAQRRPHRPAGSTAFLRLRHCGAYAGRRPKTFTTKLMTLERAYYHCRHCQEGGLLPATGRWGWRSVALARRHGWLAAAEVSFGVAARAGTACGRRPKQVERTAKALGAEDRRGRAAADRSGGQPPSASIWAWTAPGFRSAPRNRGRPGKQPDGPQRRGEVKLVLSGRPSPSGRGASPHDQLLRGHRECGRRRYRPGTVRVRPTGGPRGASAGASPRPTARACWATAPPGSGTCRRTVPRGEIVDLFHAKGRLWDAAKAIHGETRPTRSGPKRVAGPGRCGPSEPRSRSRIVPSSRPSVRARTVKKRSDAPHGLPTIGNQSER